MFNYSRSVLLQLLLQGLMFIALPCKSELLQDQETVRFVEWINLQRSTVIPSSSDMTKLYSNLIFAHLANELIDSCKSDKWIRKLAVGKSLILLNLPGEIDFDLSHIQDLLLDQKLNYDFDLDVCKFVGHRCNDYRTMIISHAYFVGCALKYCDNRHSSLNSAILNSTIFSCIFSPSDLRKDSEMRPYQKGRSCSECPNTHSECRNNLCTVAYDRQKYQSTAASFEIPLFMLLALIVIVMIFYF